MTHPLRTTEKKPALFSKTSRFLITGVYAVLCQLCFILLSFERTGQVSAAMLRENWLPYLEYPLMSLLLVFTGGLLIELTLRENDDR